MLSPPKHSHRNLLVPKKQGLDLCLDSSQAESVIIPENSRDSNVFLDPGFHKQFVPTLTECSILGHPGHQWHIGLKPVGEPAIVRTIQNHRITDPGGTPSLQMAT